MMVEFIGVNTQAVGGISGAKGDPKVRSEMSASQDTTKSTQHHRKYTTLQDVYHTAGCIPHCRKCRTPQEVHHWKYTTPQEVHYTTRNTPHHRKYTTAHHRKYTIPAGSVCTAFEGCELSLVPMALVALTEYQ